MKPSTRLKMHGRAGRIRYAKNLVIYSFRSCSRPGLRKNVMSLRADHIFGLDDIRPLNFRHGALGLYANERAWVDIRRIFKYVFEPSHFGGGLPQIVPHTVINGAP